MVISTASLAWIFAPVMTKTVGSGWRKNWETIFSEDLPIPVSPDWMATYRAEYAKIKEIKRKREWEAFLARHTATVRARIEALNKNGVKEGEQIRGFRTKSWDARIFTRDLVAEKAYVEKWGFHPTDIAYRHGRKKYVTRVDYKAGTAHRAVPQSCPNPNCGYPLGHDSRCANVAF